jgi:predicted RNA methylase
VLDKKLQSIFAQMTVSQDGDGYRLDMPAKLPRAHYDAIKKIVNGLRGEWVRSKSTHIFGHDPAAEIRQIAESGVVPEYVNNPHAFFPTPHEDVADMVDLIAEMRDWSKCRCLEAGAGDGRIVRAMLKASPNAKIDYCEIDERNQQLCASLPAQLVGGDFLTAELEPVYDYVIMNPPFQGREYQKHVRKAFSVLSRKGKLVSVMPAMALQDRAFRNWMFKGHNVELYRGEREFVGTKVQYLIVMIEAVRGPAPEGFKSWDEHNLALALSSDSAFYQALKSCKSLGQVSQEIEGAVVRIIRDDLMPLALDDDLLNFATDYFAEEAGLSERNKKSAPIQANLLDLAV